MALIPRRKRDEWLNPFRELERIQDEMNKLFNTSFSQVPEETRRMERAWSPAIDIQEKENKIDIKADLPGVKKEDVNVSVEDDTLLIEGKREEKKDLEEEGYRRRERFYGNFCRELGLPSSVDRENIKASYKDGVLELTLPKKEEAKRKQIDIDIE